MRKAWLILSALVIIRCDLIWHLQLEGTDQDSSMIMYEGFKARIQMTTIGNRNFAVGIDIFAMDDILIYTDRLRVLVENREVEYTVRLSTIKLENYVVKAARDEEKNIYYNFDAGELSTGDKISIFADKYISYGEQFYNIDTLVFLLPEDY